MQSLFDILKEKQVAKKKGPSHELAATVQEIIDLVGATKKYGFGYWLGVVKRSGISFSEMQGILKEVRNADAKYPKGALLTVIIKRNGKTKKEKGA